MKFNKAQRQAMVLLGMAQNATDEEATAFFNTLTGEKQQIILGMADKPADEPAPPASPNSDKTDADAIAEQARRDGIKEIAKLAGLDETWANMRILEKKTVEQAREAALKELSDKNPPVSDVVVGDDQNLASLGPAISDAILQRANVALVEIDADGNVVRDSNGQAKRRKPHDRAREFRGLSLMEISREYLGTLGISTRGMSRAQVARLIFNRRELYRRAGDILAVHSTSDFDNILADTINKTLRAAFAEFSPNWMIWAREASAPDFKTISRTQLSGVGTPPRVREGIEYTYASVSDFKETYTLAKYGHIFMITWEALINDDLSAFSRIPMSHGAACARLEDDLAYAVLTDNAAMSDGVALFHAASHGNLASTPAALSVTSLGAARAAMRSQTGINSDERLDILPVFLIVPVALETTARQLVSSTVDPSKSNATPNPFNNALTVVANPRLDDNSATAWYLAASPSQIDTVEVCFLEGERQPQLSEEEGFDVDCRKYKVRHTVAAAAIDWRGLYKNNGT